MHAKNQCALRDVLVEGLVAALVGIAAAGPAAAAEVTSQRLLAADKEPQNWLMNHRTYDGQRRGALPGPELRANSPW